MPADHQLVILENLDAQEDTADHDGCARKARLRPRFPCCMAERESTIVTDEQISTKVLNAVRLMLSGLVKSS